MVSIESEKSLQPDTAYKYSFLNANPLIDQIQSHLRNTHPLQETSNKRQLLHLSCFTIKCVRTSHNINGSLYCWI